MGSHRIALERRNAGMGLLIPCRRSRIMPCVLSSGHVSRPDVTGWAHHRSIGGRHGPYHTIKPTQPPRRATWQSHRGQITGRTAPEAPVSTRHATRQSHHSQIPPRPTTTAMKKPSACAEKSLSVGRRLSITGNHGIWRLISTITCRQTRNAPNQACHTSLPAAFAAATSASSWASLASDSPVMNFSTRAFASLSSC